MLTDAIIKAIHPQEKIFQVADSNGLKLKVMPSGSKIFVVEFRLNGKKVKKVLGDYLNYPWQQPGSRPKR